MHASVRGGEKGWSMGGKGVHSLAKDPVGAAREPLAWPGPITQVVCPEESVPTSEAESAAGAVMSGTNSETIAGAASTQKSAYS